MMMEGFISSHFFLRVVGGIEIISNFKAFFKISLRFRFGNFVFGSFRNWDELQAGWIQETSSEPGNHPAKEMVLIREQANPRVTKALAVLRGTTADMNV
jgi:hypothetical protein